MLILTLKLLHQHVIVVVKSTKRLEVALLLSECLDLLSGEVQICLKLRVVMVDWRVKALIKHVLSDRRRRVHCIAKEFINLSLESVHVTQMLIFHIIHQVTKVLIAAGQLIVDGENCLRQDAELHLDLTHDARHVPSRG